MSAASKTGGGDDLTPVIVGVGQINDRPMSLDDGLDPLGLMEAALRAADQDAGGGWLRDIESLAMVDQISFPHLGNLAHPLADRLGAQPKICNKTKYASGDSPILLLNEAANRIGAGEIVIAAVVGGEALRTAAQRAAAAQGTAVSAQNATRAMSTRKTPSYRQSYGLVAPVDVYPLYENAGRAAYGQTLEEGQSESAAIWSQFSEIAAKNPGAWIRRPTPIEAIKTPSSDNRPIAFPYLKLMVANSSVNQGAGFIITSLGEAKRRGVPEDRIIYVGLGAAAAEPDDFLARDRYDRSPSMAVSILKTLEFNGVGADAIDFVELYSCFPCVPKMARRVLNWPLDTPATVVGGLTFGGGPIGNYMSHAVVSMVDRLREGGRLGLLFANGGFATHNHTILLSRAPLAAAQFPQNFDVQPYADADRGPAPPLDEAYIGPATIETYTVLYARDGSPKSGVVVARTPDGSRTLATIPREDTAAIADLTDGVTEPVGRLGDITSSGEGLRVWRMHPTELCSNQGEQ